jgi:3-hydroxyacyl-CoA dehydrogenase/HEAT repeat protein
MESDLHDPGGPPIERAAVIGAGTMGSGIAVVLADAGLTVRLIDAAPEALERARAAIRRIYAGAVAKGRLTEEARDARIASIALEADLATAADADLVIEAVFESLALKREIFERLGALCRPETILATNTSTLDVDAIASAATHPERSLGLHFFSPAHAMRLLEVVRGRRTSQATLDRAVALGKRLGKTPVVVGNCDGFVGNRMLLGYKREAEFLVLDGATPAQVDAALEAFGFAMGPFAVSDLAGIDVGWRAKRERIERGAAPPFALTDLTDKLVAAGRLGQKTGKGWYRYEPGSRERFPDPEVDAIVAAERTERAHATREVGAEEILERCVDALINEGARILDEGFAESAADIDTIWVNGYGFPKARGGPMRYAADAGYAVVFSDIERFAQNDPAFWRPTAATSFLARRLMHRGARDIATNGTTSDGATRNGATLDGTPDEARAGSDAAASLAPVLVPALAAELSVPGKRSEVAAKALAALGDASFEAVVEMLQHGDERARTYAAKVLAVVSRAETAGRMRAERSKAAAALIAALGSSQGDARAPLIDALGALGDPAAIPVLIENLNDGNYLCVSAARALGQTQDPRAVDPLVAVLSDQHKFWVPRGAAAVALGDLGALAESSLPALESALAYRIDGGETWDERAREAVQDSLERIRHPGSESKLTGKGSRYEMWGIY